MKVADDDVVGGKVSIGLTATTIVSQWTWSATLLQSSTVASKVRELIGLNDIFITNDNYLVWNQWTLLVRRRGYHPDYHILHPVHHVEDESSRSKDVPAGDQGEVWEENTSCLLYFCFLDQCYSHDVIDGGWYGCSQ